MKILTFLVGLIIMSNFILQVQANNKTDSLLLLIKSEKEDTSKVNILNDVARKIMYANPDSSILLSNHALDIINKTNNLPEFWKAYLKSQCLKNLATFQYLKGNYTRSLDFYLKSLAILEKSENVFEPNYTAKTEGLKSKILSNIGALYDEQEEYQKALDYYFKALKIVEVIKNKDEAASYLPGNIGVTYKNIAGTTPKTIGNFHKIDSLFQKALNFFFSELKIDKESGNKDILGTWIGDIGLVYYERGEKNKALDYYLKALNLDEETGNKNNTATWLGCIGKVYTDQKKYKDAFNYLYHSIAISKSISSMDEIELRYECLSRLYEKSDIPLPDTIGGKLLNIEQMRLRSLYYYKRSIEIRDTLFSQENKKQLVQKEMNYEFEKKEAFTKAEHDKQIAIAEAENKKQKIVITFVLFGLLVVIAFAAFISRTLHITRKQKQIIEQQKKLVDEANEELNQQNEEIASQRDEIENQRNTVTKQKIQIENIHLQLTQSVDYATRIQKVILPDLDRLHPCLADHFVLYRPKDKVSGDFYWCADIENNLIISVVDCTGHGVPGAFMSMLGTTLLHEIVEKENNTNPANILERLRDEVVHALKQGIGQNKQKDGMDMSLIVINKSTLEMLYAGANNPVYIIKPKTKIDEAELIEIKPDNMPIAIYEKMEPFTNQVYKLQKGDRLYLMSDGYEDQFGGEKYKKFTSKRLKELLLRINEKPMVEQHDILKKNIIEWMNGETQMDDITILGIKI